MALREAHPLERETGVGWYASETPGIGGRLKSTAADFRVREVEGIDPEPLHADPGAYPHLVVRACLEGWDTFAFADRLASALGTHREAIDWAGTKDKRAITTQLFSIAKGEPSALPAIPNADLEPIGRFGRGLTFGDLVGNDFEVVIREPDHPDRREAITTELVAFGDGTCAVPNFFGPQRFGSRRPITHRVGLAIVRGDWETAVLQYLGTANDREPADTRRAREVIAETRDWERGMALMPGRMRHERHLLEALLEEPAGYRQALEVLPERLRRLFVHAAQSYIFNRIVTARGEAGLPWNEARPGDRVCFGTADDRLGIVPDIGRSQAVDAENVGTVNRHLRTGRAFLTAPLVGTETELPEGAPGELVASVLEELDLGPASFDLPDPYGSTGTDRPLLVHPDVEFTDAPLTCRFSLPSGSYATTVLREYLKGDPDAMA